MFLDGEIEDGALAMTSIGDDLNKSLVIGCTMHFPSYFHFNEMHQ